MSRHACVPGGSRGGGRRRAGLAFAVFLPAGLALGWPAPALSQQASQQVAQEGAARELGEVVVSASALPLTETSVNQHVSVYTREQIEREAPASLSDFLARRAGLVTDRRPHSGGFGSLFLRGADPSHVVVLIDGIRQNDPLSSRGSAVDLNTLTLDEVERIEIVRGASAVAHSEALAGVVQIFTRPPGSAAPARATAEVGGRGLAAASASVGYGPWQAGIAQREDGELEDGGFSRARAAHLGFRDRWGATQLQAQIHLAESKNVGFPDDSGGLRYAVNRSLEERRSDSQQLALSLDHQLSATSGLGLRLVHFQRDTVDNSPRVFPGLRDPAGLPATNSDGNYRRDEIEASWRWHAPSGWDTLFGVGSQVETGTLTSRIFFGAFGAPANFDIRRVTTSVFGEGRKSFGPWSLQLGLRYEQTPGQDSLYHPALSFQYQASETSPRLGMALSSASKLPSFYALGHPLVGNPALRPEHSEQVEAYYASPDTALWKTRITVFEAHYRDLVDFDPGPPPRLVNRSSISSTGLEFSLRRAWNNGVQLTTQGMLMTLRVPEGSPPLRFRPRQQASVGVDLPLAPQWWLQSSLTYIGRRFDSSIPTGDVELGGYAQLDLALNWRGRRWQAFAAIDNALNHGADEAIGTPIIPRRLRVGLRWSL